MCDHRCFLVGAHNMFLEYNPTKVWLLRCDIGLCHFKKSSHRQVNHCLLLEPFKELISCFQEELHILNVPEKVFSADNQHGVSVIIRKLNHTNKVTKDGGFFF